MSTQYVPINNAPATSWPCLFGVAHLIVCPDAEGAAAPTGRPSLPEPTAASRPKSTATRDGVIYAALLVLSSLRPQGPKNNTTTPSSAMWATVVSRAHSHFYAKPSISRSPCQIWQFGCHVSVVVLCHVSLCLRPMAIPTQHLVLSCTERLTLHQRPSAKSVQMRQNAASVQSL